MHEVMYFCVNEQLTYQGKGLEIAFFDVFASNRAAATALITYAVASRRTVVSSATEP
jgi:hypothetical protein